MNVDLHVKYLLLFSFLDFRRVLDVDYFLLGITPASEFRRRGYTQRIILYLLLLSDFDCN
jgi:hypothetical protein